jgi:hypothetical protein
MTTHNATYQDRHGRPSKLDPEMAKDLRSHHAKFGIDKKDWSTTYRREHYWKQPEIEE